MKPIKEYLDYMFDHTILVAEDDPALPMFKQMAKFSTIEEYDGRARKNLEGNFEERYNAMGQLPPHAEGRICELRIVPGVGCELTAKMVYDKSAQLLDSMKNGTDSRYDINPDVRLVSVECFEHGANSAIYYGDYTVTTDGDRKVFSVEVPDDKVEEVVKKVKEEIEERRATPTAIDPLKLITDFAASQPELTNVMVTKLLDTLTTNVITGLTPAPEKPTANDAK
jgi:hypothetical protein